MADWTPPKINWTADDDLSKEHFNRIEKNLQYLAERDAGIREMIIEALGNMGRTASLEDTYLQLGEKIKQISMDATANAEDVLAGKTFYAGGAKRTGSWPGPMFGDGQHGHYDSDGSTTIADVVGATIVADYKSFRLNQGHILTTTNPVRVLVIRSWGDITINGEINLDKKGGYGDRYITIGGVQYDLLGGFGGDGGRAIGGGGDGGTDDCGQRAAGGLRGGGGGGGGGGQGKGDGGPKNARSDQAGIYGSRGFASQGDNMHTQLPTSGTYGAGGGGSIVKVGEDGYAYAGNGGRCDAGSGAAGGGGGIDCQLLPRGAFASAEDAPDGIAGEIGGGALVLVAAGNIIINGVICARGGRGNRGGDGYRGGYTSAYAWAGGGGGGGGSGGGRVIVLHRGNYTNNGSIILTGGAGGAGGRGWNAHGDHSYYDGYDGSPGVAGTVQVEKLQ